jgi:Ala-tRNA(Pro) deacylase
MQVAKFLEDKGVAFKVIRHDRAYTAQEVAAAEHVTGHMFAKTVIAKGGEDEAVMFVLPADRHVDFGKASELLGGELKMATEGEMKQLFPDCDIGAEPPFGSQYGVATYVDESLATMDEIVFRAGSHEETVRMKYGDFADIESPAVADFSTGG